MAMVTIDKRRSGSAGGLPEMAGDGRIGADDVLRLRRAIYQQGGIDREKAAALFKLNRDHRSHDPAWAEFYVEALSDFFYWREGSDSSLTDDAERMLMEWIGPAAAIDDATEMRLLLHLMFRSNGSSEAFRTYVLDAVRHSVLHSSQALYGQADRRPGVIDAADVEVIRKLVYGLGGQSGMAISAAEADFLFELEHATAGAAERAGLARSVRQGDHHAPAVRRRFTGPDRRGRGPLAARAYPARSAEPGQRARAAGLPEAGGGAASLAAAALRAPRRVAPSRCVALGRRPAQEASPTSCTVSQASPIAMTQVGRAG